MPIIPVKVAFDEPEMKLLHDFLKSELNEVSYHGKELRDGSWYGGIERTLHRTSLFKWDRDKDTVWFPYADGGGAVGFKLSEIKKYFMNRDSFKGKRYQLNQRR